MRLQIFMSMLAAVLTAGSASGAVIRGRILEAAGGVPAGNVKVLLIQTGSRMSAGPGGEFTFTGLGTGRYTLRASDDAGRTVEKDAVVDSPEAVVEVNLTFAKLSRVPPGCVGEFTAYQAELGDAIARDPSAVRLEIGSFSPGDSIRPASVVVSVTDSTPSDVYLLKDHEPGGRMYLVRLTDAVTGAAVRANRPGGPPVEFVHGLSDVRRVASRHHAVIDTLDLHGFDFARLAPGDYLLQLIYVFPDSRLLPQERSAGFSGPIPTDQDIGGLYCMILRGRFESNLLPIHTR